MSPSLFLLNLLNLFNLTLQSCSIAFSLAPLIPVTRLSAAMQKLPRCERLVFLLNTELELLNGDSY